MEWRALLVALIVGSAFVGCAEESSDLGESSNSGSSGQEGREKRNPDGTYNLNCDYVLGDFGESGDPEKGYRFVGGGRVENTGNVGIVVRVRFRWDLLGQEALREERMVRLKRGKSRKVDVSIPATQDQIDLHQSADADCRATAKIVDDFGRPPKQ